jgi:DnaJ-class molecular chaperone
MALDSPIADNEEMVPCPTCNGTGETMMRGDTHRGYDDPDYLDTCGICGGSREVPASMFTDAEDDEEDDSLAWSV